MSEFKCPFCGSTELKVKRGTEVKISGKMNSDGSLDYEPITDYCCQAQAQNAKYRERNFHPDDAPDIDDISKL